MRSDGTQSIADLAEVNPPIRVRLPAPSAEISFVPMPDVSESGEWVHRRTRRLAEVSSGFTPFQEGDVLFAKITPCMENGKGFLARGLSNGVGFGSTEFHVLRAKPGVDPRFVFHLVRWPAVRKKAECMMIGSAGQQRVAAEFFMHFRIGLFDSTAQRHIADILDAADEAIRRTEAVIAKLKLLKDGLLHDLLTRGLDEHGRLRDPIAHPEQFKDTPLGRIPKEWAVADLGQYLSGIDAGHSPDCPDTPAPAGEWGVLKVSSVRPDQFVPSENKRIVDPKYVDPHCEVGIGDLLITRSNTYELVGLACIVRETPRKLMLCDKTLRLRPVTQRLLAEFLLLSLGSPPIRSQIEMHATGSSGSMKNISQETIRHLRLPLPHPDEQKWIVEASAAIRERLRSEEALREKLELQKTGLMHDLLTGRVPVTTAGVAKHG